jgi:guanylate kinase
MSRIGSLLFILSAPSGTGKTSVSKEILRRMPDLIPSISYTTRLPRDNERNGIDYWFVSPETFQDMLDKGEFAEWAIVHGHFYGTPLEGIKKDRSLGKDILLAIDVQGGEKLRQVFPQVITIFLLPPSWEILRERLWKRETNSIKDMEQRFNLLQGL